MSVCLCVVVYHKCGVIHVPGQRGEASVSGVDDRILDDVNRPRQIPREEALRPARQAIGLRKEPPGQETVVWRHLAKNDVLCQNVIAERNTVKTW